MKKGYTQLELAHALNHKSVGLVSQAELYLNKQPFNFFNSIRETIFVASALKGSLCSSKSKTIFVSNKTFINTSLVYIFYNHLHLYVSLL